MALKFRGMVPLLQVFDMPTSVRFYRDILGFSVVNSSAPGDNFDWGLLQCGHVDLMLNTAYESDQRPTAPDSERRVAHADTGLFFACDDVDAAYAYFQALGLNVAQPIVREYGMKQLYLNDPDGYELCFQCPA